MSTVQLMNQWIGSFIQILLNVSKDYLMPFMILLFFGAIFARLAAYFLVRAQDRFTAEFEKRVNRHRDGDFPETRGLSFSDCTQYLLRRTSDEIYTLAAQKRSRKGDTVLTIGNRLFMVQDAADRLSRTVAENVQFGFSGHPPSFEIVASHAFTSNHFFNKLFGIVPMALINRLLTILPGLFVVGGIFGTFVGIMIGLPMLKSIDPTNIATSSKILGDFLIYMAYSIGSSVLGVFLSVCMTVVNNWTAWDDILVGNVERLRDCLTFLWSERENAGAVPTGAAGTIPAVQAPEARQPAAVSEEAQLEPEPEAPPEPKPAPRSAQGFRPAPSYPRPVPSPSSAPSHHDPWDVGSPERPPLIEVREIRAVDKPGKKGAA